MTKIQLLHDYLILTGLIKEEDLNINTLSREITGMSDWELDSHYKTVKINAAIVIDDYAFVDSDIDKLEYALKYWLDRFDKNADFVIIPEIKTSSTSDLWIDITLIEESSVDEKGNIIKCFERQDFTNKDVANDLIIFLKNVNGEEKQVFPKV